MLLLEKVKLARRIKTDAFDSQIEDLLEAGLDDLRIVGAIFQVSRDESDKLLGVDPLVDQALITYVACNFGEPDDYDELKRSYDEQKAQIRCNPRYEV